MYSAGKSELVLGQAGLWGENINKPCTGTQTGYCTDGITLVHDRFACFHIYAHTNPCRNIKVAVCSHQIDCP